jgi:hypothetical protein
LIPAVEIRLIRTQREGLEREGVEEEGLEREGLKGFVLT